MDEIEQAVEEIKKYNLVDRNCILQEIESIKERKRMLNLKMVSLQNILSNKKVVIPKKFKKIKEVVLEKDTDKFYYNLVFYGFVDWDRYIGYLIKDTKNFYIKIESPSEKWDDNELEEELLITEEMARTVLNYDEILEKQDREFLKYEEQYKTKMTSFLII